MLQTFKNETSNETSLGEYGRIIAKPKFESNVTFVNVCVKKVMINTFNHHLKSKKELCQVA